MNSTGDKPPVLRLQGIAKRYPGVVALGGVDLSIIAGEVNILLGENGAGKSTLMKIISGAVRADAGDIFLDGQRVQISGPKHAQELGIGIIYQELNLIPHLNAAENIFLGREPSLAPGVIDQKKLVEDARKILVELKVPIDPTTRVSQLSLAQRQMVEVAKALSLRARVLIMDEPTSALTESETTELFATIARLKARHVAIVYISHRMEELFAIGDRVCVLRDGRNAGERKISETTMDELVRLMVGRELREQFPKRVVNLGGEILRVDQLRRAGCPGAISFSLRQGEILGVAGLMGSGRTKLARCIFGADKISSGSVSLRGQVREISSPRDAIKNGLGFLTEDRKHQGLVLKLSVQENICLPSVAKFSPAGVMDVRREREVSTERIRELRIKTPTSAQRVVNLSGGNQQKVVLAKWLTTQASILIFDEPTRGIDVGAKAEIYELMNQLAAHGAGIIMISSELPEILGMSDRILVMHEGVVAAEFSAHEATQEKLVAAAIGQN